VIYTLLVFIKIGMNCAIYYIIWFAEYFAKGGIYELRLDFVEAVPLMLVDIYRDYT
jgi:hypothetical protein